MNLDSTSLAKTNRYISLILSILICIGSALLLYSVLRYQSISSLWRYPNLSKLGMLLYFALGFIFSFFAITYNILMLRNKAIISHEDAATDIIDNTTRTSSRSRKHLILWRMYLTFSSLVMLFVPSLFLIASLSDSIHMNTNDLVIIIFFIIFSAGGFLFFDALNILKNWKKG